MILLILVLLSIGPLLGQTCLAVDGEWVTARDLAGRVPRFASEGPEAKVVRAPFPGARRLLVPATLPGAAADDEAIEPFCVERRMRTYSREEFREAIERSLTAADAKDSGFELLDYDRVALPSGKLEFIVPALPPLVQARAGDAVLWRGKLFYAEGRSVPVWVRLRLWIEGEACVLTRDVARGEDLKESDCRIVKVKFPPFSPPPVRDASLLERTTAARRMQAQEPIYQALLVRKPDVEIGKPVELRVINGATRLKFEAKAAASGRTGDTVAVTNPANGKRLEGQVVGKDMVEVHLK